MPPAIYLFQLCLHCFVAGVSRGAKLREFSLSSGQFLLHTLVLCQIHFAILLLQLLGAFLPLLSTLVCLK